MEDGVGGGVGGTHSSPTALGLGISVPTHQSQISEFCLTLGGGTKVFYPRDQTTGVLKYHHLQARVTHTAMSVPHGHLCFLQNCG